jgi:hypothetical protein
MATFRTTSLTLVLLLALLLPLQTFASVWNCNADDTGAAITHHPCADHSAQAHKGAGQHHHCGTCCVAAIAPMPFLWVAPHGMSCEDFQPLHRPPPSVALDRLDRPPRLV